MNPNEAGGMTYAEAMATRHDPAWTIWKTPLGSSPEQRATVAAGAIPLRAAIHDGRLCLWWWLAPRAVVSQRRVFIYGTGAEMSAVRPAWYVDTVEYDGQLWHIFVDPEAAK